MKPIIMTIHPWHLHVKNTKLTYRKTKSRRPSNFVIGIMGFYLLEISSSFEKVLEILYISNLASPNLKYTLNFQNRSKTLVFVLILSCN
jgi:hypothetical protein